MQKYSLFRLPIKYVITPYTRKYKGMITYSPGIRMSGKSVNFGDKNIKKSKFNKIRKAFKIHDIDVNKILVSKKESYGANKSIKYSLDTMIRMTLDLYA